MHELFNELRAKAQTGHERRIVADRDVRYSHHPLFNYLETNLSDIAKVSVVPPGEYADGSPKVHITDVPPQTPIVVIPGSISGRNADRQTLALTKIGNALRYKHPNDDRTPRAQHVHYLLSDLEGRGNKPTVGKDGKYIDPAELHYAPYLCDQLTGPGKADSLTILDWHDAYSMETIGKPVLTLTALKDMADFMKKNKMFTKNSGLVIADNGTIGRDLFFSAVSRIPIVARMVKERRNGDVAITDIYGSDDLEGIDAILLDDMIASGGTIITDAKAARKHGVHSVIAGVTHVKGVEGAVEKIREGTRDKVLDRMLITNSTPYYTQLKEIRGVDVVNIYPLMAKAARAILDPSQKNEHALQPYIFPMSSHQQYLGWLHQEYPHLAPDFKPTGQPKTGDTSTVFSYR